MKRLCSNAVGPILLALLASGQALAQGCFVSGTIDQPTYFVAVDSTDFTSRETALATFTVVRSRNGAADVTYTTPTITEIDAVTMPGVYALLLDEDMTLDAGDDMQHMALHITHAGMAPVTKEICIARPKITAGQTVTAANGAADADVEFWNDVAVTEPLATGRTMGEADSGTIASVINQTEIVLSGGASNDDAYAIGSTVTFVGGSEKCEQTVADYVGSLTKLFLKAPCPSMTLEAADSWTIRYGGSGAIAETTRALAATIDGKADGLIVTTDATFDDTSTMAGTDGAKLATAQPNYAPATSAQATTIIGHVDDIGVAGIGLIEAGGTGDHLTAVPYNAAWDPEIQSEVTDALNAYDPPTKAELDAAIAPLAGATYLFQTTLDVVTDQTHVQGPNQPFTPDVNNAHIGRLACIEDVTDGARDCVWLNAYNATTDEWTLSHQPRFTIAVGDILRILPFSRVMP